VAKARELNEQEVADTHIRAQIKELQGQLSTTRSKKGKEKVQKKDKSAIAQSSSCGRMPKSSRVKEKARMIAHPYPIPVGMHN
jgi:hypothetical protein